MNVFIDEKYFLVKRFFRASSLLFDILILGGGLSGTMVAIQLLRRNPRLKLVVAEK